MADNEKRETMNEQIREHGNASNNEALTGGQRSNVNQTSNDLDEKSSGVGRTDGGRTSGISTKDGLTGSDLDGQVTSR